MLDALAHKEEVMLVRAANSGASDGVVAVVLSPRFLLTMAAWIDAADYSSPSSSVSIPLFALSIYQSIPVKQIWFERDLVANSSSSFASHPFAVLELERDEPLDVTLSASLPAAGSELEVDYLDPAVSRASAAVEATPGRVLSSDACQQNSNSSSSGVFCIQSEFPNELSRMGFAVSSGRVVGLAGAAENQSIDGSQGVSARPFIHFGSAPHRAFLDQVTTNSLLWDDSLESAQTQSPPSSVVPATTVKPISGYTRVSFFQSGEEVACGGIQISRDYILTSASCVLNYSVTRIAFQAGAFAQSVAVAEQIVHPKFASSSSQPAFDVAMLFAPGAGNPTPTIKLDLGDVGMESHLLRVQLGDTKLVQTVLVLPRGECKAASSAPEILDSPVDIATNASTSDSVEKCVEALPETGHINSDSLNAALLKETKVGFFLSGFQPDTASSSPGVFFLAADAENFINAVSVGHEWAVAPAQKEPSYLRPTEAPSPAPATKEATAPAVGSLLPVKPKGFVAGLRLKKSGATFCGGALVASLYVLTAASCVTDGLAEWVSIGPDEIIRVKPNSTKMHPKFGSPHMASNNVAILELEAAAYASPVVLASATDFADGATSTLSFIKSGSGNASVSQSTSYANIPLWSKRKCASTVPGLDDSILCAGSDVGQDACVGNSGSPLTIASSSGDDVLAGVMSAAYECGQQGMPGLYARVSALVDFIQAYSVGTKPVPSDKPASTAVPKADDSGSNSRSTTAADPVQSSSSETRVSDSTAQPLSTQSLVVRSKLIDFLVGSDMANIQVKELKSRLRDDANSITLFSTGDISALVQIIEKHSALPLNARRDRFGTVAASEGASKQRSSVSAAQACGV